MELYRAVTSKAANACLDERTSSKHLDHAKTDHVGITNYVGHTVKCVAKPCRCRSINQIVRANVLQVRKYPLLRSAGSLRLDAQVRIFQMKSLLRMLVQNRTMMRPHTMITVRVRSTV